LALAEDRVRLAGDPRTASSGCTALDRVHRTPPGSAGQHPQL